MPTENDFEIREEKTELKKAVKERVHLLQAIVDKCKSSNIEVEPMVLSDYQDRLVVYLPAGRDKREVIIRNIESAKLLLRIQFEKVQCLSGYRAYCSFEDGYIEAMLDAGRRLPMFLIYSKKANR